jgi:hypothetical protein
LVQFVGQIIALSYIRRKRPDIARPFRMWLYPLPSAIALAGWMYVFLTSGWSTSLFALGVLATGVLAFIVWRRPRHL